MFKALTFAAVLAAFSFAVPVWAQEATEKSDKTEKKDEAKEAKLSREDKKFAHEAAAGGMMEVQLGQVAAQKAASAEVKQFGERMAKDHGAANQELEKVAAQKGITLPKEMPEKEKKTVDKLSKLSGEEFDKAYMSTMVRDHKKDVKAFEKAAKDVKDPDLKGFAEKTLPTLQEHLKLAEQTAKAVGAEEAKGETKGEAGETSPSAGSGQNM